MVNSIMQLQEKPYVIWQIVVPSPMSIPAAAMLHADLHEVLSPNSFWDAAVPSFRIVKDWLQDTCNRLPFTEKPCLGIVTLCPIKENRGMMEGRKGKPTRIQVLLEEHFSVQRHSKAFGCNYTHNKP